MGFMLGNLTISQMEKRLGVEFSAETRKWLDETRQEKAENIMPGKWHCFDIPFVCLCGDMETAKKMRDCLVGKVLREEFQIALEMEDGQT